MVYSQTEIPSSGFSIFAVTSFTIIALTCAFLASITVVLAFREPKNTFAVNSIGLLTRLTVSILIFTLLVTLFSSVLLTGSLIAAYLFVRFVALVREHGREGVWIWAKDTNFFSFNALPSSSSGSEHDEAERPEVGSSEKGPESADVSDQEAPRGFAVKHEDSSPSPSPNETLIDTVETG